MEIPQIQPYMYTIVFYGSINRRQDPVCIRTYKNYIKFPTLWYSFLQAKLSSVTMQ